MDKANKRVPFTVELAKKIQSGEVKGTIVNRQMETVRIFAFDVQNKKCVVGAVKHALSEGEYIVNWDAEGRAFEHSDVNESFLDLLIELSEESIEVQKCNPYHNQLLKLKECVAQLTEVNQGVIDDLENLVQDLKRVCEPPEQKYESKVGDKPSLVCPKCLKPFDDCKSWPAYHNREDYECPHCGHIDDSSVFRTNYPWHPYNKTVGTEFKPFDKVLVRNVESEIWRPALYAREDKTSHYRYECVGCKSYHYCIPYEGNEHLVSTTDNPKQE